MHKAHSERLAETASNSFTKLIFSVLLLETPLLRLTAVRSPAFIALLHAGTEIDVDTRRRSEAERFGHFDEIEVVDVEDCAQAVRGVGLKVGAVAVFGGLCKVSAQSNQLVSGTLDKLTLLR